jgi:hypothetical protein
MVYQFAIKNHNHSTTRRPICNLVQDLPQHCPLAPVLQRAWSTSTNGQEPSTGRAAFDTRTLGGLRSNGITQAAKRVHFPARPVGEGDPNYYSSYLSRSR